MVERQVTDNSKEKRAEERKPAEPYYSVEFTPHGQASAYQFKIWNISSRGLCILVKENSRVLNHIKVGDINQMTYYRTDSTMQTVVLKTEIKHISQDEAGRFPGHFLVGLAIL
jgi:hypothetical protein